MRWNTKQTRTEIYNYIKAKSESYPEIFSDGRLHIYFTEDLITVEEAENRIRKVFDDIENLQFHNAYIYEERDGKKRKKITWEELKQRHLSTFDKSKGTELP